MICSHDTFTYLEPKYKILNLIKRFWKTQEKDLYNQYKSGIRYFDIRLYWTGTEWGTCHGITEFNYTFKSIKLLLRFFRIYYSDVKIRLCLDKGDDTQFENEIQEILDNIKDYPQIDMIVKFINNKIGLRYDWKVYKWTDLTHKEICFNINTIINKDFRWYNLKHLYKLITEYNLKKFALTKQQHPTIEMINDPNIVYFMDFV